MACVVWKSDVQMALKACIMVVVTFLHATEMGFLHQLSDRCVH